MKTFAEYQIPQLVREACVVAGSQYQWATKHKLSQAYVNDVIQGRRRPGPGITVALGLVREVVYKEAHRKGGE